jgi:hypothetical protein
MLIGGAGILLQSLQQSTYLFFITTCGSHSLETRAWSLLVVGRQTLGMAAGGEGTFLWRLESTISDLFMQY